MNNGKTCLESPSIRDIMWGNLQENEYLCTGYTSLVTVVRWWRHAISTCKCYFLDGARVWRRLFSLCYTLHARWYPRIERDLFDRHDMQLTVVIRVRVFKRSAIFHSVLQCVCMRVCVLLYCALVYGQSTSCACAVCYIVGQGNRSFTSVITFFLFFSR